MAVVDVWLQLLPEFHTDDGMQLLEKHANDSIRMNNDMSNVTATQGILISLKTDGQIFATPRHAHVVSVERYFCQLG